jgi:hypothetical protein
VADIEIPRSHWIGDPNYIQYWEPQLRKNIAVCPDPSFRFEQWLGVKERGEGGQGVRLIFIEQPYLGWAETIERMIAAEEKRTRESCAYEITHRNED